MKKEEQMLKAFIKNTPEPIEVRIGTARFQGKIYLDGEIRFEVEIGGKIIEVAEKWNDYSIQLFKAKGYIDWPSK